jgi:hypothetical protein
MQLSLNFRSYIQYREIYFRCYPRLYGIKIYPFPGKLFGRLQISASTNQYNLPVRSRVYKSHHLFCCYTSDYQFLEFLKSSTIDREVRYRLSHWLQLLIDAGIDLVAYGEKENRLLHSQIIRVGLRSIHPLSASEIRSGSAILADRSDCWASGTHVERIFPGP